MRRYLLLGLSAIALSQTAVALTYSQNDNTQRALCKLNMDTPEEDGSIISRYNCSEEQQDEIIAIGQIVGNESIENIPAPVTVISTQDLENRNQIFLSDILRSVPGLSVNRSGPGGGLTQLRLRGSEANHVLVLVDGVEVANPSTGEFDLSGLRSTDILKVEVLRGEQSALYGSDAIGGVINIITRANEIEPSWSASAEAGSFGTFNGQVSAVLPVGGSALSISLGGTSVEGYDISGLGGEKDGSQSFNINAGLNNVTVAGVSLSAKFSDSSLKAEFDEDSPFDGRLDDTNSVSDIDSQTARIDATFDVAGLSNQIALSGSDTKIDTQGGFQSLSDSSSRKAAWAIEKDLDAHNFTVLGEVESESYGISPSFAFAPAEPTNTNYGLAGEYRFTNDNLSFTASARNDFNERFNDAFTWKLGATYGFEFGGRVRASVGTGVKNPTLIELFGFFPESNFVGNADLIPEESLGYGVGYSHTFDEDLTLSVDYFRSDLESEIFTDFSSFPFLARNNVGESQREGVEFSADWKLSDAISLYGSATLLDTAENGVEELRRPEFQGSFTATVQPLKGLSLTGSIDHTGSQLDTDFATFQRVELDAFTLVGLNAAYDLNEKVTLTLRGDNLLDEDYEEVVGYRSQGRGVYGGLRLRFE